MAIVPCRDCKWRSVGCHATCDLYISWKREHDKVQENKRADLEYTDYNMSIQGRIEKATLSKNSYKKG